MTDQTRSIHPEQLGDAPTARRLPTRDEYLATIVNLTPRSAQDALAALYVVRDRQAAEIARLRRGLASQAEQLRRNGTLLCRLRDLDEQRDRAWAEHDAIGRAQGQPDDLTTRLAGRLADALGCLEEAAPGIWVGRFPATELDRWKELLAEHADRSPATTR